ncbi:hypothetical protein [Sulfurospirillum cavolei]|uniref:hypothetical protein n=1 Tax=Sulfurospirillum cavolei TaxID=366522 RepID=UPI000764A115|nr:hypothetical protein [Sulfurospirillum cavolei]
MGKALYILNELKNKDVLDMQQIGIEYEDVDDAIAELAEFREAFEVMKKLEQELKGINPELMLLKLVTAALKE